MPSAEPSATVYRGRFAPSPTGPLHFGSLIAAVGSYLRARERSGAWLVRIDDLDRPRQTPGAVDDILSTLEAFGLCWDESPVYQSLRDEAYQAALDGLIEGDRAYPCGCSRREVAAVASRGPAGLIYPGTCRNGLPAGRRARSWRVCTAGAEITVEDRLQAALRCDLAREIGDFIVRRGDGLFAYHLACVVDDAASGITEVVRGSDLLWSTPPQMLLQRLLGLPTPGYLHLPVAVNDQGHKLSKQTFAAPLQRDRAAEQLTAALTFLGQNPPGALHRAPPAEVLEWAREHWRWRAVPNRAEVPETAVKPAE